MPVGNRTFDVEYAVMHMTTAGSRIDVCYAVRRRVMYWMCLYRGVYYRGLSLEVLRHTLGLSKPMKSERVKVTCVIKG